MTHPNETLMRGAYDAFSRGDLAAIKEKYFAPDIVFHVPGKNQVAGDYCGVDAVFALFGKVFELGGGSFNLQIHDVVANDEHVVGLTTGNGTRESKAFSYANVHVMHIRDGRIAELWEFPEQAEYDAAWS